jgi:hypothetical protein
MNNKYDHLAPFAILIALGLTAGYLVTKGSNNLIKEEKANLEQSETDLT